MEFHIDSLAQPDEIFLAQFVVVSDIETQTSVENRLKRRFPDFELRFHYGELEHLGEKVESKRYGFIMMANAPAVIRNQAYGGAAFGKAKSSGFNKFKKTNAPKLKRTRQSKR